MSVITADQLRALADKIDRLESASRRADAMLRDGDGGRAGLHECYFDGVGIAAVVACGQRRFRLALVAGEWVFA